MYTHIYGSEGKHLIPQKVLYIGLHNLCTKVNKGIGLSYNSKHTKLLSLSIHKWFKYHVVLLSGVRFILALAVDACIKLSYFKELKWTYD